VGRPEVLIVNGWGDWAGVLRLPSLLRRAGADVALFAEAGSKVRMSRFIDDHVEAPAEANAFVAALRDHFAQAPERYEWLILGNEPTLDAVARCGSPDWTRGFFPVDPADEQAIARITCKAAFAKACDAAGVPVPMSCAASSLDELRSAAGAIGYPMIIKPNRGWAGDGVRKVRDETELITAYGQVRDLQPFIAQRFLDGKVGSTQMLLDHGVPVCWSSSLKRQCWPEPFGPGCVREMCDDPQIEPILRAVGGVTGFHGLCGIDWIRRADDERIVVLEFNPRPTPAFEAARFAGVDFARSIAAMLSGQRDVQRPVAAAASAKPVCVYMFPQHPKRCLMTRDLRGLLAWLPFAAKHAIPWDEPRLLWADLRVLLRQTWPLARSEGYRLLGSFKSWVKQRLKPGRGSGPNISPSTPPG
jgi:glutathione synthase/RimK-type ligase-like ATP-grasp enzyme